MFIAVNKYVFSTHVTSAFPHKTVCLLPPPLPPLLPLRSLAAEDLRFPPGALVFWTQTDGEEQVWAAQLHSEVAQKQGITYTVKQPITWRDNDNKEDICIVFNILT